MDNIPPFIVYLISVNITAFLLVLVNKYAKKSFFDILVTIFALLGGSIGAIFGILIFDRKPEKENMLSRILIACILVIQITVALLIKGDHQDGFNFNLIAFFKTNIFFLCYLVLINIMAFTAFGMDKYYAVKDKSRIPIIILIGIASLGGTIGGLSGMYLFRHKTSKSYFSVGLRAILLTQLIVLFYLMNI